MCTLYPHDTPHMPSTCHTVAVSLAPGLPHLGSAVAFVHTVVCHLLPSLEEDTKGHKSMALSLPHCLQLESRTQAFSAQRRSGVQLGLREGWLGAEGKHGDWEGIWGRIGGSCGSASFLPDQPTCPPGVFEGAGIKAHTAPGL